MSRLAAFAAVVAVFVGLSAAGAQATVPPPSEPATTAQEAPATSTAAAGTAGTSVPTAPVAERGGASAVDITKAEDEAWTVRRIATTVGVVVVALAIAGYVYGRVRSHHRPASSSLVRTTE
jgi:hypothetical protein